MTLQGKNAVIYGGGGVIGGAIGRVFAREGARVFLVGRSKAKLDAVAADIVAAGGQADAAQVDAFDQQAVDAHAEAVAAEAGGIDIAVHAISVMHDQGTVLANLSLDEFMRPIDGVLRTLFIATKAVTRHMGGARPGVILTLSEPGSKLAIGGILGHAVSSAGKEVFSRVLAAELAPNDIRVVCIRPHALADGPASDSYTKEVFEPAATALGLSVEEWMAGLADSTMLKRLPTASDVAETAAFLASDRARAMTGTIANLTGGALVDS